MIKIFGPKASSRDEEEKKNPSAEGGRHCSPGQIRLQGEINELDLPPNTSISFPDPNNIMNFDLQIRIDDNSSLWYGATYNFSMAVSPSYPYQPPRVHCNTKIYHPNIDLSGNVCLNILRGDWKPVLCITAVIMGLNFLFLEPNPNDPLNHEAAELMRDDTNRFYDNVRRSLRGQNVGRETFPRLLQIQMDSNNSSLNALGQNCPYCDIELEHSELQIHLDQCDVYQTLIQTFSNQQDRARLYSNYLSSSQSEEELTSSIRYFEGSSSDSETPEFKSPIKKTRCLASCPVCFNEYILASNSPLVLPSCGHTVCENCLNQIVEHNSVIKCPVCRALSFKEVECLPVNYALLELAEQKKEKQTCSKHGLELVGYCKDDDSLLCGICVFQHKGHQSFLLDDKTTVGIAESRRESLQEEKVKLAEVKEKWEKVLEQFQNNMKTIQEASEIHVNNLKKTEKYMISRVKEGTENCIQQVKSMIKESQVDDIGKILKDTICGFKQQLKKIKMKQVQFEELSMVEKLRRYEPVEEQFPPSLEPSNILAGKLRVCIDYEQAIKSCDLKLTQRQKL